MPGETIRHCIMIYRLEEPLPRRCCSSRMKRSRAPTNPVMAAAVTPVLPGFGIVTVAPEIEE
jgi:hypothetical protein